MIELLVDTVIAAMLVALAAGAVFSRALLGCIAFFIAFGMALTLAWVRLQAIDLALAEAAIGAGLTGVLLWNALARERGEKAVLSFSVRWSLVGVAIVLLLALLLAQALQGAWSTTESGPLAVMVLQKLDTSGVSHPVTAVLLNFRAWDTLLELLVLLLALLGVKQLRPMPALASMPPWPLLLGWSKVLVPLLILVAGYLLWRGANAPGGAFQAGAVLAAGGIILRLNHLLPPLYWSHWRFRTLVLIGPALFVGTAVATAWFGDRWLDYPGSISGALIVVIEIAATIAVAATLTLLVVGEEKEMRA